MVGEAVILLRIQHFEQRARGIAVEACRELIHLVEHHDRVRDAALLDAVHDAPCHRADVGSPVTADIRLVAHTAETHADILSAERARNRSAYAGLARAGCADKEQNGAGLLSLERHHRNLLQNAILHFFETEVILVQHLLRRREVNRRRCLLLPREIRHIVEVIIEQAALRTLLPLLLEALQDLFGLRLCTLVHPEVLDLQLKLPEIRDFFGVQVVELLLQIFNLLFQRVLAVHLLIFLFLRAARLAVHLVKLQIFAEQFL